MDDVIARLRESEREESTELFERGREVGAEWARRHATAAELRRLHKAWQENQYGDENSWLWADANNTYMDADRLVWQIRPSDQGRVGEDFFNEEVLGGDRESLHLTNETDFIHGFAIGAIEVWNEVSSRL